MGWTASKIYTRTGDRGDTYCAAIKARVPKDHPLIEFVGSLDEAVSSIGLAAALCSGGFQKISNQLKDFQRLLFNIGFLLSGHADLSDETVTEIERIIDEYMEGIELKGFILPGGTPCSSAIHVARATTRRAERMLVRVIRNGGYGISPEKLGIALRILNRLGDALFAIGLWVQAKEGALEYV
jgi:cob(I)alamin adenosyltransferase